MLLGVVLKVFSMQSSTLTGKGQITIPAELRRLLGLKAGDRIGFELADGVIHLTKREDRIEAAFGLIQSDRSVTDGDMEQAIRSRARNAVGR